MHNEASEANNLLYNNEHLEVDFDLRVMSLAHGSFYWALKDATQRDFSQTVARNTTLY
jgi:hypothetical protein